MGCESGIFGFNATFDYDFYTIISLYNVLQFERNPISAIPIHVDPNVPLQLEPEKYLFESA